MCEVFDTNDNHVFHTGICIIRAEVNSLVSVITGRSTKTHFKNNSVFWRNWEEKTCLVFLEFFHRHSDSKTSLYNSFFGHCSNRTFINNAFNTRLIIYNCSNIPCYLPIDWQIFRISISAVRAGRNGSGATLFIPFLWPEMLEIWQLEDKTKLVLVLFHVHQFTFLRNRYWVTTGCFFFFFLGSDTWLLGYMDARLYC